MNGKGSDNPQHNSLMNLFKKRDADTVLPSKKPGKKVKPNEEQATDPLYQILSWRDHLQHPVPPPSQSSRAITEPAISEGTPSTWGKNLQGIFLNVDWSTTSMSTFKQVILSEEVLSNGMAFVWGTKTNIGELLDHFEQMGYVYAQNFAFVMLSRSKIPDKWNKQLPGNKSLLNFFSRKPTTSTPSTNPSKQTTQPAKDYELGRVKNPFQIFLDDPSEYFSGSQRILYMFRKVNKKQSLELRHQRTSDVFFTIGEDDKLDWKGKEVVYNMIETLLINANYQEGQPLKLMEIWADKDTQRKGWIMVSEGDGLKKEQSSSQEIQAS